MPVLPVMPLMMPVFNSDAKIGVPVRGVDGDVTGTEGDAESTKVRCILNSIYLGLAFSS